MGFSSEWDQRYSQNTHLSVWPWSDVVSLVHRHCAPIIAAGGRVLELGCGAGANIPLFLALGMEYYAIEGSAAIVERVRQRYPQIADHIRQGDFTRSLPFDQAFDLVLDRASLTHNNLLSIRSGIDLMAKLLCRGGLFIGCDWFSIAHDDFRNGEAVDDEFTRTNHASGSFTGVGRVHFSDEAHLRNLFSTFDILYLEEKLSRRHEPPDGHQFAAWNIVARKTYG
jgi:SAM-dependent methyltransferase